MSFKLRSVTLAVLLLVSGLVRADDSSKAPADSKRVSYHANVLPLLSRHCVDCHGVDQADSGFRVDRSNETEATQKMYGIGQAETDEYAQRCIIARRMAERGVRFIVVPFSRPPESQKLARMYGWDSHEQNNTLTPILCKRHDQPIAALLTDLKERGLLEDTLFFWGGEFGRTAGSRVGKKGREHNCNGYSIFLAGGGTKGGLVHGRSGDTANGVVENEVHVHDLNATMLHLLGLDHERLTYHASGRHFRLTDVYGNVVNDIIA